MRIRFICAVFAISIVVSGNTVQAQYKKVNIYNVKKLTLSMLRPRMQFVNVRNNTGKTIQFSNSIKPITSKIKPITNTINDDIATQPSLLYNYKDNDYRLESGDPSGNHVLRSLQEDLCLNGMKSDCSGMIHNKVNQTFDDKNNSLTGQINYTFVPLNNKTLEINVDDNILTNSTYNDLQQNKKDQSGLLSLKVLELDTVKLQPNLNETPNALQAPVEDVHTDSRYFPENIDYEKQAAENARRVARSKALQEKNKLLNEKWEEERLKNEVLAEVPLYGKRMVLEYVMKINPTKMKCINSEGITRTIYSSNAAKQGLTLGSPMYKKNLSGIDMGIPLVIYDLLNEVTNYAYGGENPFKRREMLDLASKSYEDLVKIIDDPNINKAMAMPTEQLKEIKLQQRKTQANSNKSSGGSAEGYHE